jgi:hypothetical protein
MRKDSPQNDEIKWKQDQEYLSDGWLFKVECQKSQLRGQQSYADITIEPYNKSLLRTWRQEAGNFCGVKN